MWPHVGQKSSEKIRQDPPNEGCQEEPGQRRHIYYHIYCHLLQNKEVENQKLSLMNNMKSKLEEQSQLSKVEK